MAPSTGATVSISLFNATTVLVAAWNPATIPPVAACIKSVCEAFIWPVAFNTVFLLFAPP